MPEIGALIITILVFVILFGFVIGWAWLIQHPSSSLNPDTGVGVLGDRCTIDPNQSGDFPPGIPPPPVCGPTLTCVSDGSNLGWCRRTLGERCMTLSECVPEARICIGVCALEATGGLNQPCISDGSNKRCADGLVCSPDNICKLPTGAECNQNSDCLTGSCFEDQCVAILPNGAECESNEECLSSYCAPPGVCQNPGVVPGTMGAACPVYLGTQLDRGRCQDGLVCFTDFKTSPDPTYGICTTSQSMWPTEVCELGAGCPPPTVCWRGQCMLPRTETELLTNSCAPGVSTGVCSSGYSCTTEGRVLSTGRCVGNGTVPDLQGEPVWSLVKWNGTEWKLAIPNLDPPDFNGPFSITSIPNVGTIAMYTSNNRYIFIGASVPGQTRQTIVEFVAPGATFQRATLTPGGRIAILYTVTSANGDILSRVYLGELPPAWRSLDPLPSTTIYTYKTTWAGYTKDPELPPDPIFFAYTYQRRPLTNVRVFTVDDTTSRVRLGLITATGDGFVVAATLDQINVVSFEDDQPPLPSFVSVGVPISQLRFYASDSRDPRLFYYTTLNAPDQIQVSGSAAPPLIASGALVKWDAAGPPRASPAGVTVVTFRNYDEGGGFQVERHLGTQGYRVPGTWSLNTQIAVDLSTNSGSTGNESVIWVLARTY